MDNKFLEFQQYIRSNPIVIVLFVLLQIFFVIILAFFISKLNSNNYSVSNLPISNLKSDLESLPENSVEAIQSALYDNVTTNGGTLSSISDSDAKVREGTMTELYFDEINMHYINFIVDIPSIEQSYQIFNEWSDNKSNPHYLTNLTTMVMCPLESQIEYSSFKCRDSYNHNGQSLIASNFLPLLDPDSYSTLIQNSKAPYIVVIAPKAFMVDDDTKTSYTKQTEENIKSLGFPSDAFNYYVSYGPEDPDVFLDYVISNP